MSAAESFAALYITLNLAVRKIVPWLDRMENQMTPEEARKILKEVKANSDLLESCAGHEFEQLDGARFTKYECKHCRGRVDGLALNWYRRGLAHGNKEKNEMKKSLEFYADSSNYDNGCGYLNPIIMLDGGDMARATLEELK